MPTHFLFCCHRAVEPHLRKLQQRTLVIVSDSDLLLPSKDEGPRLQKLLPRANLKARALIFAMMYSVVSVARMSSWPLA